MSKTDKVVINVQHVDKTFKLPHEKETSIKGTLINFAKHKKGYEKQHVLKNISFDVKKGEFFGIVGRNGSGKSTLLKLLAGIYSTDHGSIDVKGSLVPFIELGVGFNPELTGRENVFLNGALLGFTRREMSKIYDDIVGFAEIERFMDQKLKNYSSGMQVRLAFSIAIRARQDILLVDEVLAVGDIRFQNKCYKTFRELKEEGRTIVFVTHDMSAVERFCDRTLVLSQGVVEGIFTPREAASRYQEINATTSSAEKKRSSKKERRWGDGEVKLQSLLVNGEKVDDKKTIVEQGKPLEITFTLEDQHKPQDIVLGISFYDMFGTNMAGPNSLDKKLVSNKQVTFQIPKLSFNPGVYGLRVVVFDRNAEKEYDHIEEALSFVVITKDQQQSHGKINLFGSWQQ